MMLQVVNFTNMSRIKTLDILRGIAASSIMIYHYIGDALPKELEASHILSRIGYYGVSVFYILSGLTLSIVYLNKLETIKDSYKFYQKRIYRIYPLMIVCMLLTLMHMPIPSWYVLFMNFSGLFGLFDFENYIGVGVWSIGNELVFYLFFPILLFIHNSNKKLFYLLLIFSFMALTLNSTLLIKAESTDNWGIYINPINQIFYFISGIVIGQIRCVKPNYAAVIICLSAFGFTFYPLEGNVDLLINSYHRLVFSACCLLMVYGFYSLDTKHIENWLMIKALIIIGEISYAIYLLHPLVAELTNFSILVSGVGYLSAAYKIPLMISITLVTSYLSYHYFELPITRRYKIGRN